MVIFRCKSSGNTVSFTDEQDIKSMRLEEGYTEVKDEVSNAIPEEAPKTPEEEVDYCPVITAKAFKKLGRPFKK